MDGDKQRARDVPAPVEFVGDASELRLEGFVESARCFPDTGFAVLRVTGSDGATATWVGRARRIDEGVEVSAAGEWGDHPTYGRQFRFARLVVKQPTTPEGIRRRLEIYPHIGETLATRIVKRFGLDTLTIFDKQPRRLLEIRGVSERILERLLEFHKQRTGPIVEVENFLLEINIPTFLAERIVQRYGEDALTMTRERPYRLSRDIRGIGFQTADRIARATGMRLDSDERVDAGVLYALERAESDGHCAQPLDRLVMSAAQLLELPGPRVREGVERLLSEGALVAEVRGGMALVFPARFVTAEQRVAKVLAELAVTPREPWIVGVLPDSLSPGQRRAVEAVALSGLAILTGGPGTGKTTVTRQIIELAEANKARLLLGAPTGRAAKRLSEATGHSATTIHRLLEVQGNDRAFARNAETPLEPGLVVIDEASMLDLPLAEALLCALTPEHRLLMVGDIDQLPSVGPGNVLRDIIAAAEGPDSPIPVVRLDRIFRQAEGSSIVRNAHRVLRGESPDPDTSATGEFFVIHARDPQRVHELVMRVAVERAPEAYGLDARTQVQILSPMHKGRAGTLAFNEALQAHHTRGQTALELPAVGRAPARLFRVGDRVMQVRNDHERNVFNGDIGVISHVDPEQRTLVVEFDGVPVSYDSKQLSALQLAYAITIHKSQGCEFPAVIVPLLGEHHVMLRRNLLYTAVTRARRLCVIVGDPRAIARAVRRGDAALRYTGLAARIEQALRDGLGAATVHAVD